MKTRTKVIVATAAAVLLGGVALAGASQADGRYGGRYFGDHHGGYGMGGYMGHHHEEGYGPHYGGGGFGPRMLGMFDTFDANDDGKLTQAEIDQVRGDRLAAFDADGDGKLTLAEYERLWVDAMRDRMIDRFQALDENGDAAVTAEEFARPYGRMVARMDRNDDGAISRDDADRRGPGPYWGRSDDD